MEIEERRPLTKAQTRKVQRQYTGFHCASLHLRKLDTATLATLFYYYTYRPRVVTLREDPALVHALIVLTS